MISPHVEELVSPLRVEATEKAHSLDAQVFRSLHSEFEFGREDRFVDQDGVAVAGKLEEEEVAEKAMAYLSRSGRQRLYSRLKGDDTIWDMLWDMHHHHEA